MLRHWSLQPSPLLTANNANSAWMRKPSGPWDRAAFAGSLEVDNSRIILNAVNQELIHRDKLP